MNALLQIFLLMALSQIAAIDPLQRAAIDGTVQQFGSGVPIPDAGVELRLAGNNPGKPLSTVTTSEGKFAFKDIPPGEYRLAATHSGYIRSEFGQRGPNGRGLNITLAPGQTMKDVRIALTETGTISGRIKDGDGDPIANVQVQALKFAYLNGHRGLVTVKGAVTNDLGEYRLYWLPPERYVVMATPLRVALPDSLIQVLGEDRTLTSSIKPSIGELILPTDDDPSRQFFFPGTPDPQFASTVTVRSGDHIRDVDMGIAPPPGWRVRGKVANLPVVDAAGVPEAITFVRLRSRDAGVLFDSTDQLALYTADQNTGVFEIRGVLPGSYYVDATGDGLSSGRTSIEVADKDIDNLIVPLSPWFDVPVHVSIDRRPGDSEFPDLDRILIDLSAVGVVGLIAEPVRQESTGPGKFMLRGVSPFDYRISALRLPESAYVKSIRMDGRNVLDEGFHLDAAPADPIEIELGLRAGIVSGNAVTDKQVPLDNVTVVLVPNSPRRQRWDLYKTVASDAAGYFKFAGTAPGDYKVFAWEDVPERAWQDPEFISKYESRGKLVHIEEASSEILQVVVAPAD